MIVSMKIHKVSNLLEFVVKYKQRKLFKETFKMSIYQWLQQNDRCDEEAIIMLLQRMPGKWNLEYIDDSNSGYFKIYEVLDEL